MEVRFSPETEHKLSEAAAHSGHPTEEYVRELVERYLDEDTAFREAVRQGFASLDRGDFIDEQAMNSRVDRMLRS
jgi:predicted DNA-binding protein